MVNFTGFCTYPHGGYVTSGLFLACAAAVIATTYAAASCRFVLLTFTSSQGDFEEYFRSSVSGQADQVVNAFQTGVGLFQWLRPVDRVGLDWSEGACVGYQTSMTDRISDVIFESSRGFAVFAVLLSFGVTVWAMFTACLAFNWYQLIIIYFCLFAGSACAGLTFLFLRSKLCQEAFLTRNCTLDEGGLVMCAAVIFWLVAFLIAVFFLKPMGYNNRKTSSSSRHRNSGSRGRSGTGGGGSRAVQPSQHQKKGRGRETTRRQQHQQAREQNERLSNQIAAHRGKRAAALEQFHKEQQQQQSRQYHHHHHQRQQQQQQQQEDLQPDSMAVLTGEEAFNVVSKKTRSKTKSASSSTTTSTHSDNNKVTVDDVSNRDQMEVYLSRRLDRIQHLTEADEV